MEIGIGLAVVTLAVGIIYYFATARGRRHEAIVEKPFPLEWETMLRKNVRHYALLPPDLAQELKRHMQIFLEEKTFEGCGGLEVTEEMRVTVAALACFLLLNRDTSHYKGVTSILLYPEAYKVKEARDGVTVKNDDQGRLGESWDHGSVVLSWNSVKNSASNIKSGQNLVLHEFAHQLDQENGPSDGVPAFEDDDQYSSWAEVLAPEFERLKDKAEKGKGTVMDHYGATNPAEFFAVATETFFEKAEKLKAKRPELYEELKAYYRVDPAQWHVSLREEENPTPASAEEPEESKFVMPAHSPFADQDPL